MSEKHSGHTSQEAAVTLPSPAFREQDGPRDKRRRQLGAVGQLPDRDLVTPAPYSAKSLRHMRFYFLVMFYLFL